jgi:tetratricopeptide (TPR) repeat protein
MLHYNRYAEVFDDLIRFPERFDMADDNNIEGLFFLFKYIHSIQKHFIEGTFSEGIALIPELMEIIESDRYNWDHHRILVFYYRIACLYFGSGDNDNAITYLNLIINQKNPDYRADIQVFARILNLIAHFEMGNAQLVEYQVKSVYRFLSKMEDIGAVHREVFRFLRRIPRMREQELRNEFTSLRDKLIKLENDPFERRPFMYLDIISWLESKIEDKEVQDVIREKFVGRRLR